MGAEGIGKMPLLLRPLLYSEFSIVYECKYSIGARLFGGRGERGGARPPVTILGRGGQWPLLPPPVLLH